MISKLLQNINQLNEKWLERLALAAIVILAAALRFANLAALGYVNHYYTAAVVSMLKSWHNFFYLAAEPGGAVSVDKTPVGLWIQAASAYFLGVNTLGVLLPEILAGLASIVVLYILVRKYCGTLAGLIAALALAITPIVIATDRNNTSDSLLILILLLAAWAFLKATATGKLRFLLVGAALLGIGFNIKMLEAFLPLPAFYGLYLLGSGEGFWRKAGKLLLASALLVVISLSWVTIVDLTPASQRPYVGSSGDNSEISLITGYNGMDRLLGMFGRGGAPGGGFRGPGVNGGFPQANNGRPNANGGFGRPNNGARPGSSINRGFTLPAGNSGTASGSVDMGSNGVLRLFLPPLSKNASWLLPFGLAGALLLIARGRWRWPVAVEHQAVILWGGWLATCMVFFSVAQFYHEYYLSFMGAPLAALVGIGAAQVWELRKQHTWTAAILLCVAVAGTLGFQAITAAPYIRALTWLPWALALLVVGAVLWLLARKLGRMLQVGFAGLVAAMLVAPALWAGLTTAYPSLNQSLPSVYSGQTGAGADLRGLQINPALLAYIGPRIAANAYLMAVPSSMQGSDYVIATGRPVLYLGGFMGIDQVVTPDQLAQMVQAGKLRFIYWDARSGRNGGGPDISSWVTANCKVVAGFDATVHNSGAPGGIGSANAATNSGSGSFQDFGALQISLYDCGSN